MKHQHYLGLLFSIVFSSLFEQALLAKTLEHRPLELLSRNSQSGPCPDKIISYETARPYQEGGYSIDGQANLTAIASNISLSKQDSFSAVWVGDLKTQYRTCQASAGITTADGQPYQGHSYMRLQLTNSKVYFILDMTGMSDANGYTTIILSTTLRDGNPRWTWGGSD